MKEEDADWLVYHLIADKPGIQVEELAQKSGLGAVEINASLDRLDRCLLIEKKESGVRVLSVGESMIKCQIKYDDALPFTIENGVIKERKHKET